MKFMKHFYKLFSWFFQLHKYILWFFDSHFAGRQQCCKNKDKMNWYFNKLCSQCNNTSVDTHEQMILLAVLLILINSSNTMINSTQTFQLFFCISQSRFFKFCCRLKIIIWNPRGGVGRLMVVDTLSPCQAFKFIVSPFKFYYFLYIKHEVKTHSPV